MVNIHFINLLISFQGVYRATNAEIDTMAFFMFPVEAWYWKVICNILDKDTDKILMCVTAEMHMKHLSKSK